MIAKHVPMKSLQKSNFTELVGYITDGQGKHERVGNVIATNCQTELPDIAALEVLNTQLLNTRSEADKTYHLIVSFRAGDLPDEATLKAIEERICAGIGFAEHQRVSAVHHDTDNLHIHIAINKIHPTRYTIHEPFNAYHSLGQLCDKLENEYGLQKDNHKATKTKSENRASDMERHADVESLLGWIKRECQDQIRGAQSWSSLHQVLRENGLEIREHANGLVISAESGISVKASSVHREFSKKNLEERLGRFAAFDDSEKVAPTRRYEQKPMRSKVSTVELYARYKQAQHAAGAARAAEWGKAIARKNRLVDDAKRTGRLKRAAIRISGSPALGKKVMYAATSKTLRDDIATINQEYMRQRQAIYEKYQRQAWADWLRKEATAGDQEALEALRSRQASNGLRGNTVAGQGGQTPPAPPSRHDSITKRGTVIYKVGASAVRDDGEKLNVSRGADEGALVAALRMAADRYGPSITVNGTDEFKERIARAAAGANLPIRFADAALDARRQQLVSTTTTTKENAHGSDSRDEQRKVRGRTDRRGDGRVGPAAAARAAASRAAVAAGTPATTRDGGARRPGHAARAKSNTGAAGRAPSPEARNTMPSMSERGVVHVAERGEMLLPRHVLGGVEQQGAKPDNRLRRDLHRPGRVSPPAIRAAPARAQHGGKPNIGKLGNSPPPASKDRLRGLAQLGSISIGEHNGGGTPVEVAGRVAPQSPQPQAKVHDPTQPPATTLAPRTVTGQAMRTEVRRDLFGLENKSASELAADKYIAEREQKRTKVFDIPKHIRYNFTNDATVLFGGLRHIDGQALALLKKGEEVMVLPVDAATARRLKRVPVGEPIGVNATGAIKTKGRSR